MKIAIAGPGRSGTSFLVALFSAWGLATPTTTEHGWNDDAEAGLEHRIGKDSTFEVDKDPWLFEYIRDVSEAALASYDAILIPIRTRRHASLSRSIQDRYFRAINSPEDHWLWNSWGDKPGGAISDTSLDGISRVLEIGLWDVLEQLTAKGVQPMILNFPRLAKDFDYLWENVGPLVVGRINERSAREAFESLADESKIRAGASGTAHSSLDPDELVGLVEMLRKKVIAQTETLSAGSTQLSLLEAEVSALKDSAGELISQRDSLLNERVTLESELAALRHHVAGMENSRSWKLTSPLRRLKNRKP